MSYRSMFFILTLMLSAFVAVPAFSQWEELPAKGTTLDFALTANEKAQSLYGTAIHAGASYWFGVNGTQISAEGEVFSQDLAARAQGGINFMGISLQGFVEIERDMDSDLTTATGAYLRKVVAFEKLKIVLGGGSFVEREQFAEVAGFDEASTEQSAGGADILPYALVILGGEYDLTDTIGLYAKVIGKPQANDFENIGGVFDFGTDIVLNDQWTLKVQSTTEFDRRDGETDTSTENSVILSLNF